MPSPTVRSVSRFVWEGLQAAAGTGRVLAVFERACALQMSGGYIFGLVSPEIGNGPLNAVLGTGVAGWTAGIEAGGAVHWDGERLRVGPWTLALEGAPRWEPRPDWDHLRGRREAIAGRLAQLQTLTWETATEDSLMTLLSPPPGGAQGAGGAQDAVLSVAAGAVPALLPGWLGDWTQLKRAVAQLAGLGNGLTPAGDDFLGGVLLWAWLAHPRPRRFGEALLAEAAPCTTAYSAAFLQAAAARQMRKSAFARRHPESACGRRFRPAIAASGASRG